MRMNTIQSDLLRKRSLYPIGVVAAQELPNLLAGVRFLGGVLSSRR